MRRGIVVALALVALLSLPAATEAQITYEKMGGSFAGGTITAPILAPAADNCAAVPYSFTGDDNTGVCSAAADTVGFITGGTTRFSLNTTAVTSTLPFVAPLGTAAATSYSFAGGANTGMYSTNVAFLEFATGGTRRFYLQTGGAALDGTSFGIQADDAATLGTSAPRQWTHLYLSRSIQGSKSKALTDNTATAFVRLAVADDDYEGCGLIYTAYAEDTVTDARQTRTGSTYVAILNNGGVEAAVFSTGDSAVAVTAGTFTCTFDGNSAAADTIDLRATCDTSLAATTTLTFEYRLNCPSIVTVTPQ